MAAGYSVHINNIEIKTIEALYQACKFPHIPDLQKQIIDQKSPMAAKMITKPHKQEIRDDWDKIKVSIMRWCLRVKLYQNWEKFGNLLYTTNNYDIVEESKKDAFWGAKPVDKFNLIGTNALGRLLMELREEFLSNNNENINLIKPKIDNFILLNEPINNIVITLNNLKKRNIIEHTQVQLSIDDVLFGTSRKL